MTDNPNTPKLFTLPVWVILDEIGQLVDGAYGWAISSDNEREAWGRAIEPCEDWSIKKAKDAGHSAALVQAIQPAEAEGCPTCDLPAPERNPFCFCKSSDVDKRHQFLLGLLGDRDNLDDACEEHRALLRKQVFKTLRRQSLNNESGEHSVTFSTGPVLETRVHSINRQAVDALASYQQADEDGIMVLVSRQAIEECLPALRAIAEQWGE